MNGYFGSNSIYTNIILSKTAFHQFYKSEIDELFNTMIIDIDKRNIHINSYNNLYHDFIDFIYKYSIKYRPIL
jgi:hypothetical protein